PEREVAPVAMDHATTAWPARALAGFALVPLIAPALAAGAATPVQRVAGVAGTAAAGAAAWLTTRGRGARLPAALGIAVLAVCMWLLAQAPVGPLFALIGLLLGVVVGSSVAGAAAVRTRPTIVAALTGVGLVGLAARID